ncbi:MAG: DNA polymerase III subunit gamma/tau [Nitrospirae bacterium]|nr:DNA polymerase III subunit gamma/tau [Nitrospirota bacterium]
MDQIALYRKYRPHNFDNLVGQDYIKTTLVNAIKSNHISHAYLFSGPRGTGKTSTARLVAKALICNDLQDDHDPCNKCEFCKDINMGRLIDLIEIDAASNRGIDEVRDLKEKINFAPTRAKYKVYIIDEVHMMTKEAFNALLKTLEEPPSHAYFILATTEIHKIPETIISRCQRFDFRRISNKALMTRLSYIAQMEKITADDKSLEAISKSSDGGLRDAIGLLEQLTTDGKLQFEKVGEVLGVSDSNLLNGMLDSLTNKDTKGALKIVHELHDQGSDLKKFIHEFVNNLRTQLLESVASGDNGKMATLMRMIDIFQEAQNELHIAIIPQLPLEIAVIKIAGPVVAKMEVSEPKVEEKVAEKVGEKLEPKAEKTPEERKHKAIDTGAIMFTLASIKDNWPRITERIKVPALKQSLKSAVPVKLEGNDLTIQFNTNFHKDKVMEHDHRVEVEAVINEVTDKPVKILVVVKELEIKSVVEKEKEDNIVDEALGIFGGEVMN